MTEDQAQSEKPEGGPHVAGERGIASVNRVQSLQSRMSSLLAIGLMSTLGVGLFTWYYIATYGRRAQVHDKAQASTQARAQGEMPLPSLGVIHAPELLGPSPPTPRESTAPAAAPASPVTTMASPYGASGPYGVPPGAEGSTPKTPAQLSLERRLAGPALALRVADRSGLAGVDASDGAASAAAPIDAMACARACCRRSAFYSPKAPSSTARSKLRSTRPCPE